MREVSEDEVLDIMAIAKMRGVWTDDGDEEKYQACFKDTKDKLMHGWTINWNKERWVEPRGNNNEMAR